MDNKTLIKTTQALLADNKDDWEKRYIEYAESISSNLPNISLVRNSFREWAPLRLYLNTSKAKGAKNKVTFDLRYLGQNVAHIVSDGNSTYITTKGFAKSNKDYFGCNIILDRASWIGLEAKAFRKFFRDRPRTNKEAGKGNEEHRIESLLLTEFLKESDKKFRHIKPVTISDIRFPMPTPLKASKKGTVEYVKQNGGGIDILVRTGTGGKNTRLCIMELKDENKPGESASVVLQQAIKYTVFIRELLRSEAGEAWYKLFGFGSEIPEKLVLYASCTMPDAPGADVSFAGEEYEIGSDVICLHYLYFEEQSWNELYPTRTSL